jgi:hypothetical protein
MITTDDTVHAADTRYPDCAIQMYKGNPILVLNPKETEKFRIFSFGLQKAKLILAKLGQIQLFVSDPKSRQEGVEVFVYNKREMILLNPGDGTRFQFGVDKGSLILLRLEALRNFVAVYGGKEACTQFGLTPPV